MAHVRKLIRDRMQTILSAGVGLVNGRVYSSRVYPLTAAKLPAITVHSGAEVSGLMAMGTVTLTRTLAISVDVYVRANETFDDDVDAICVQVEAAVGADFRLNDLAKDVVLRGTDIDFSGEGEVPVGIARLTFDVRYVTTIEDATTAR
jgi:hypothetical protein